MNCLRQCDELEWRSDSCEKGQNDNGQMWQHDKSDKFGSSDYENQAKLLQVSAKVESFQNSGQIWYEVGYK